MWRTATDKDSAYMLGTVTSVVGTTLTMNITDQHRKRLDPSDYWWQPNRRRTIVHNAGSYTLLTHHGEHSGRCVEVSGINFTSVSAETGKMITLNYASSGEPILIHDCWFWQKSAIRHYD